jgi:hypothetical protein
LHGFGQAGEIHFPVFGQRHVLGAPVIALKNRVNQIGFQQNREFAVQGGR